MLSSELNYPFEETKNDQNYPNLEFESNENGIGHDFSWNETDLTSNLTNDYLLVNSNDTADVDKSKLEDIISSGFIPPEDGLYENLYTNEGTESKEFIQEVNEYKPYEDESGGGGGGIHELPPSTQDVFEPKSSMIHEDPSKIETVNMLDKSIETSSIPNQEKITTTTLTTSPSPETTTMNESMKFLGPKSVLISKKPYSMDTSKINVISSLSRDQLNTGSSHTLKHRLRYLNEFNDKNRLVHRKERNRIAAKRCRQRKIEYLHDLEHQLDISQHQIHQFQEDIKGLREENDKLKRSIMIDPTPTTYDLRNKRIRASR